MSDGREDKIAHHGCSLLRYHAFRVLTSAFLFAILGSSHSTGIAINRRKTCQVSASLLSCQSVPATHVDLCTKTNGPGDSVDSHLTSQGRMCSIPVGLSHV